MLGLILILSSGCGKKESSTHVFRTELEKAAQATPPAQSFASVLATNQPSVKQEAGAASVAADTTSQSVTNSSATTQATHRETPAAQPSDIIASRAYKSWSRFKVGTRISYNLKFSNDAEGTVQLPLYYTLSELNADEAVIDLNLPAGGKLKYPAKIKRSEEPAAGLLSPCALVFNKAQGKEIITVSGDKLECMSGDVENHFGSKEKGKQWACDGVPGGLVRLEVATEKDGKKTVWNMILDKIEIAK